MENKRFLWDKGRLRSWVQWANSESKYPTHAEIGSLSRSSGSSRYILVTAISR